MVETEGFFKAGISTSAALVVDGFFHDDGS
jgi:hypothetical protein